METSRTFPIDLVRRIRREYLSMPGLSLTLPQAQRLWGDEGGNCAVALGALVDAGLLSRTSDGSYVRTNTGELPAVIAMQRRAAPWDCRWAEPVLVAAAPLWVQTFCGGWACLRDGRDRRLDVRECLDCPRWEPRLVSRASHSLAQTT